MRTVKILETFNGLSFEYVPTFQNAAIGKNEVGVTYEIREVPNEIDVGEVISMFRNSTNLSARCSINFDEIFTKKIIGDVL